MCKSSLNQKEGVNLLSWKEEPRKALLAPKPPVKLGHLYLALPRAPLEKNTPKHKKLPLNKETGYN